MPFAAFVRSDLYDATDDWFAECPEMVDGPVEGVVYYVVVEASNGRRWAHEAQFRAAFRQDFEDRENEALALCDKVRAALAAGRRLDPARWVEIAPAYGSDAYQGKS